MVERAWMLPPKEQQASDGRSAPAAGLARASSGCLARLGEERGPGLAGWRVVSLSRSLAVLQVSMWRGVWEGGGSRRRIHGIHPLASNMPSWS